MHASLAHEVGVRTRFQSFTRLPMPLAQSAYERLRNMILTGELPPESAITENSIVDRLAIGKTPVREAMRRLVLEGLLDVTPRLGYTVTAITAEDVDELFQLRVIMEVAAARLAIDHIDDAALNRLSELSSIGYDPGNHDSMVTYVAINAEFHDIIARASQNRRLAELISRMMQESRRFIQVAILNEEHGRRVTEQHVAIVEALRARDRDAVAEAVRLHVEDGLHTTRDSLIATA
jgi:GntR family transcriptional regulator, rspAB operon transcriptional repressor